MMKKIFKYPVIVVFGLLLYAISIRDLFSPVRKTSELENRELRQMPSFSLHELIENNYTPKIEEFTEDQFIARDSWISLKSIGESLLGKKENNGVVYGKDGYLFTKFLKTDYTQYEKNLEAITRFKEKHPETDIRVMLVPTAPGVMKDKVIEGSPVVDTEYILDYARDNLPEELPIDVYSSLSEKSREYIYYRTDHHWTTKGAYIGYIEYLGAIGIEPAELDSFSFFEVQGFLGTHYSKSKNYNVRPDTLSYIDCDATMDLNGNTVSIYDTDRLDTRDKYAMFLWGNNAFLSISGKGEDTLLIIKDSYANCMIPYMTGDFKRIDVIDLRYYTAGVDTLIREEGYDHVLFLYNCESILTDNNIPKINIFT